MARKRSAVPDFGTALDEVTAVEELMAGQVEYSEDATGDLPSSIRTQEAEEKRNALTLTHARNKLVTLYDANGMPRQVDREQMRQCIDEGLSLRCPLCKGIHPTVDLRACPSRSDIPFATCPICRQHGEAKTFYDDAYRVEQKDEPQEGETDVGINIKSNPQDRLRQKLINHMRWHHPETARSMGIPDVML